MTAAAFLAVGLAAAVLTPAAFHTYVLMWICLHALLAASLRLVLLVGEVNLATAAFFGVGAYGAAVGSVFWGLHTLVAIGFGVLVATVASVAFGAIALRATGAYFLLISFAFTEVMRMTYTRLDALGGNSGIVGILADFGSMAALIVTVTVIVIFVLWLLEASRAGLIMRAVRDHNDLAECLGFPTRWVKTAVLAVGSAVAGLAGGLYAHLNTVIAPVDFGFMLSIFSIAWVIIGGKDHILGAVLGAAVLTFLAQVFRVLGEYEPLIYGLALLFALVLLPHGLWGLGAMLRRLAGLGGQRVAAQPYGPRTDTASPRREVTR